MFKFDGITHYQAGDAIDVHGWEGCPAVVIRTFVRNDIEWYEIKVDVSSHQDGFDDDGVKMNETVCRHPARDYF